MLPSSSKHTKAFHPVLELTQPPKTLSQPSRTTALKTIKMMNGYLQKDWEQLKKELKDAFRHADSRVNMYTRLYLEQLCKEQLECGYVSLKAFILAYDNISRAMIGKGALSKYSLVEMLLGAPPERLEGKSRIETRTRSQGPLDYHIRQTPKTRA